MSSPHRRSGPHYTAPSTSPPAPSEGAAPHPDVVAAVELLLAEPDAYLYRRRYLGLITHTPGPDGTTVTDYTDAEKYFLTTAARRKAAHRAATLHTGHSPTPSNGGANPDGQPGS
ncbi:hypothetical protein [Rhodococcus erythropolis]|uniref:hypothetical protein n=1 Tax=Rhodococcus erythropolis TaxID=1833 RepID=UPI001BEC50C6|nr:hypothetical protein [Rhodococcus erythropolis]MBT2266003.1 hypothetical protein [Rhodococcus erythropolis]